MATPVTMPDASTDATEASPVFQVPPVVALVNVVVAPIQTVVVPEIGVDTGSGSTVIA